MQSRYIIAIAAIALIFLPMRGNTYISGRSEPLNKAETAVFASFPAAAGIALPVLQPQPEPDPGREEGSLPHTPAGQPGENSGKTSSSQPSVEDAGLTEPGGNTDTPVSHGESPAPKTEEHPAVNPDKTPGEDEVIVRDFPPPDPDTEKYDIFKSEVQAIIEEAERLSGIRTVYGVFVMDLASNFICGVNENLTRIDPYDNMKEGWFNSASVVKLFQGYILCDMMRRGELSPEETYHDPVTGRRFKLLKMIKDMISYSDNNYSNAALRLVGNHKSNEVLDRLGIYDSRIYGEMSGAIGYSRENNLKKYGTVKRCARITPRDAGLILYNVYANRETDIYMKTLDEALKGNIYNTRIPVGVKKVNPDYVIAHKTGTNSQLGVYNDAGIIYCKRPFILVVFTESTSSGAGQGFIRILAEKLTRYFDSLAPDVTQQV